MPPQTAVALDPGGRPNAIQSKDGSGLLQFDVAFGKAWSALGVGISSRPIRNCLPERPAFQAALATASSSTSTASWPGGLFRIMGRKKFCCETIQRGFDACPFRYDIECPHRERSMKGSTPSEVVVRCLPKPRMQGKEKTQEAT